MRRAAKTNTRRRIATAVLTMLCSLSLLLGTNGLAALASVPVGLSDGVTAAAPPSSGAWMASLSGRVFSYGDAASGLASAAPPASGTIIADVAATPTGRGFWLASLTGKVYAYGDAKPLVAVTPVPAKTVIVAIAGTPSGAGAWLVSSGGTVFRFGDAAPLTSLAPPGSGTIIVDMAPTPTGRGFWLASLTGKVYTYGDAKPLATVTPVPANTAVVAISPTPTGAGAWLVSSAGAVFRFGDAPAVASPAPPVRGTIIVDMTATPTGAGFWLTSAGGAVFRYGDAQPLVSSGPPPANTVIVALTTAPRTALRLTAAGPSSAAAGGTVDYTFTVKNTGVFGATGVRLTVDLPTSGTFVSSTPSSTPSSGRTTLDLGTLAAGSTATATLRWIAPADATTLHLQAHAVAGTAAVVDSATVDTAVTRPRTVLAVTAAGPSPVTARSTLDYAFSVTNTGTFAASAVRLSIDLPAAGAFVSSVPAGTPTAGSLALDVGLLAPGVASNVTLRWTAPATATTLHVTVHASAANADAVISATVDTTVEVPVTPPAIDAPPLDTGAVTPMAEGTAFLYSGADPPQVGVVAGTIDPVRAAVLRGRTLGRDGAALAGVTVRVLDHPELGSTVSRDDGRFDLAANGGGVLVLDYAKTGYLPAQRPVDTDPQDFALAPDVVLVALDTSVTAVDLTAPTTVQVARGSAVTDSSGTRQATLLLNPGTSARMTLPDGTVHEVPDAHLRATEFTVGPTGERAMPGALPPSSGYTYAADYSLDEALAAGATAVTFDRPVYTYLENFLHFPAGTNVPSGYYDRQKAAWVAGDNGRVVKVTSITAGVAELDTDGDGSADNDPALGITDAERAKLTALYAAGQSLWRVPVDHFSAWDSNWGVFPPADATGPAQAAPDSDAPQDKGCTKPGSVIECENQILGERLAVAGTPYSLTYDSSRTPGRRAAYTLRIPLTGSTVPASAKSVELSVQVAGQSFSHSFPATPNQSTTYTWDGRDAYGRTVLGKQTARVRIAYTYTPTYVVTDRFGYNGDGRTSAPIFIDVNPARGTIDLSQTWTGPIGAWDGRAAGLGGWSLDIHHTYDPVGKVLYRGDGKRVSATGGGVNAVITEVPGTATSSFRGSNQAVAVAGDGTIYVGQWREDRVLRVSPSGAVDLYAGGRAGSGGDGGQAALAGLSDLRGLAVGSDGSLYLAQQSAHKVRRVAPDGTISTFAGTGEPGLSGDGGLATAAELAGPGDVAVGPDGSVFISDGQNARIRRVTPDRRISTYAGTFNASFAGDGIPATQARLSSPGGIDVGPDGSLYIADTQNQRIRKVSPNGIISTVVGTGGRAVFGNGGPATNAGMTDPTDVALRPSGELLVLESQGGGLREVAQDGIIRQVVRGGDARAQDGQPAGLAELQIPQRLAVGPTGSIYVNDTWHNRLLKIASPFPGFSFADVVLPSDDGREVYQFDPVGRHLSTADALTGVTLHRFGYDPTGRLSTVTDRDGNTTTLERNSGGAPTAIVGPYGRRTTLTTSTDGYLATVTDPAGGLVRLGYGTTGLLGALTDPRGGVYSFSYDDDGRLTADADPTGATQRLAYAQAVDGHTVTMTSGEGHVTTYRVQRLATGGQVRTITDPAGRVTGLTERSDGSRSLAVPDGTSTSWQLTGDPRFGMLTPVVSTRRTTTPSGLAKLETAAVTAAGTPNASLTVVTAVNGRDTTSVYTSSNRTLVTTNPGGRRMTRVFDPLGRLVSVEAPGAGVFTSTFDARGRLSTVAQTADGQTRTTMITYSPAGELASMVDPLGKVTTYAHDVVGRVTSRTAPDGTISSVAYDRNGNPSSVTPPGRPAHAFTYTDRDELSRYTPPPLLAGGDATTFAYNADRRPTTTALPDGRTAALSYDSAGRPTGSLTAAGAVSLTYSPGTGALTGITAPGGISLTYTRDGGLVTSETVTGPGAGAVTRVYDNDFRTSVVSAAGTSTPVTYTSDGLVSAVGALSIDHDPASALVSGSSLAGVTDSVGRDGFADVTSYTARYNGATILAQADTRDATGRLTRRAETVGATTQTSDYSYDDADRLTRVVRDGVTVEAYAYDANANRTASGPDGTVAATYDTQDRISRSGAVTYTHTSNGELRTRTDSAGTTTYAYDALGNLRKVTRPDSTVVDYAVDGRNRRVGKSVSGTVTQGFLYSQDLRPVAELDGVGGVVSRFVYGPKGGAPAYLIKGGATYRIVADQLGSPRLVVNAATGEVAQRMTYDAYGNITKDSNPGFQPFGFAGGLYDRDTGLTRFGARDYSAEVGRWTAKDPIGFDGGTLNLYAYNNADPVNATDRSGLGPENMCYEVPNPISDDPAQFCAAVRNGDATFTDAFACLATPHGLDDDGEAGYKLGRAFSPIPRLTQQILEENRYDDWLANQRINAYLDNLFNYNPPVPVVPNPADEPNLPPGGDRIPVSPPL